MYITLTSANKPINIERPIDNRNGDKTVAIHEISYSVSWCNISEKLDNNWIKINGTKHTIADGYYDFCTLVKKLFKRHSIDGELNPSNMRATITIPKEVWVELPFTLSKQLGFDSPLFTRSDKTMSYTGTEEMDLLVNRNLYIHLKELSTSENLLDGKPSQILRVIPKGKGAYCTTESHEFKTLQFKKLERQHFDSLNIEIRNSKGEKVNCEHLIITLEIS